MSLHCIGRARGTRVTLARHLLGLVPCDGMPSLIVSTGPLSGLSLRASALYWQSTRHVRDTRAAVTRTRGTHVYVRRRYVLTVCHR